MAEGHDLANPKFLVNENLHPMNEHLRKKDHTRDELLAMMAQAYPEIVSMARELSQAVMVAAAARKDAEETFYKVMGRKYQDGDDYGALISDTATLGRQAMDVLRNIAYNCPEKIARQVAQNFLSFRDNKNVILTDETPGTPKNS